MNNNVSAIFDRPQQDGRGDGIVHDERNPVFMGHASQAFDVADVAGGITHAFAEDSPRLLINQLRYCLRAIVLCEANRNSLAGQKVCEERVGGAIELRSRDDVTSQLGYVLYSIVDGRLTAANTLRVQAPLQSGDAPFQHRRGWVADTGVTEALCLQIKQGRGMLGAVERI